VKSLALALLLAAGCSAPLEGGLVAEQVSDWSFLSGAEGLTFATPSGQRFRSVLTSHLVHDGGLYLHVSTIFSLADGALDELLAGGELQLLADGRLYDLRATRLEGPEMIDPILPTLLGENLKVETTGARWDPTPERYPGTQIRQWFFRLESAGGG
jgi:hypothetical protein